MLSLEAILPASALTRYDDNGEPHLTTFERLLLALRRLDWSTRGEIAEAMALYTAAERGPMYKAIEFYLRAGKVLARGPHGHREYKLNAAAFVTSAPRVKLDDECTRCAEPAEPGRRSCRHHLDYDAKFRRDARAARSKRSC